MKTLLGLTGLSVSLMGIGYFPDSAEAIDFQFTKIVDTSTPTPSGIDNFTNFSRPVINGNNIIFEARTNSGRVGLFTYKGTTNSLDLVADTNTPIPNGVGNFTGFRSTSFGISGSNVVFAGIVGPGSNSAIFKDFGSGLELVANASTTIPGEAFNFGELFTARVDGNRIAFSGRPQGGSATGIYLDDGNSQQVIANFRTPQPNGTGNFGLANNFDFTGTNTSFFGRGSIDGIYLSTNTGIAVVADQNTAIPNGIGNFVSFELQTALDGTNVSFAGKGINDQEGIYFFDDSTLSLVADKNTLVPKGTGTFDAFGRPAVSGDFLVFDANVPGTGFGIYTNLQGELSKVITGGDILDGKTVSVPLDISNNAIDGDRIVFSTRFNDGSFGIYTATPVPFEFEASLGLTILGCMFGGYAFMKKRKAKRAIA